MAKITKNTDVYLRVDPKVWIKTKSVKETIEDKECSIEQLMSEINRHVDDVEEMDICYDTGDVCEFCGSDWTTYHHDYNGGCCEEDEKNNPVQ